MSLHRFKILISYQLYFQIQFKAFYAYIIQNLDTENKKFHFQKNKINKKFGVLCIILIVQLDGENRETLERDPTNETNDNVLLSNIIVNNWNVVARESNNVSQLQIIVNNWNIVARETNDNVLHTNHDVVYMEYAWIMDIYRL